MQQHLLLVDDEPHILEALRERFERDGFRVTTAATGGGALAALGLGAVPGPGGLEPPLYDCLILDLMLPDLDGFEVLRRLRRAGLDLPVILLTARNEDVDKIVGLELGADDYVVKPFNPRELVARVRALLRRLAEVQALRAQLAAGAVPVEAPAPGGLRLDAARRTATFAGQALDLRPKEFDLLALLVAHPGQVFTRETLLNRVWGYDSYVDPRTVDVHVRRLREKLTALDPAAALIETERGVGYRFRAPGA
jgi:DNA-binding response OmpR family regulator